MRILITGASGYVGSALIQRLLELEQDEIYALDLHPTPKELTSVVKLIKQDLTRYDELNRRLEETNVDVGHLAAKILPKTKIGRGALIGAGSVVAKDVPDRAIVYGVPAKINGYLEEKELQRYINSIMEWV